MNYDLITLLNSTNVAQELDDDLLQKIGLKVTETYEDDKASRADWEDMNEEYLKLATQVVSDKSYPWENASNVKYPLLTTAAIQFHARAYPALINNDAPVKPKVIGPDPTGIKASRANRVATYMSWQVMEAMEEWQEDMDRLLLALPIVGSCYKKVYFSPSYKRARSELILPSELVINYNATDFQRARKTHQIYMDDNEVRENMKRGVFLDIDLGPATKKYKNAEEEESAGLTNVSDDEDNPRLLLEQHTWWDIDDDGYKEPYIITVDYDSGKVVRIVARWNQEGIETNDKGELISIAPLEYFIKYPFVPNPASNIYDLGFGSLLGPINEAINTITNQLIDAGTLANLQGGFLGKGIRIKGGVVRVSPGEWKVVQSTGDDLRKNIFPMPFKEPSAALFQLLQLLLTSGERLSSVTDIMMGENPGQNQPYATTAAVLEQGLKVFTGIYKRIYRALGKEYKALFKVNRDFFDMANYMAILDLPEDVDPMQLIKDFMNDGDVTPAADPNYVPSTLKMAKAQSLVEKMTQGLPLNPQMVALAVLEAEGHENIEALMQAPEPQPDFKVKLEMDKLDHQKQVDMATMELEAAKLEYSGLKDVSQAIANMARAKSMNEQVDIAEMQAMTDRYRAQEESVNNRLGMVHQFISSAQQSQTDRGKLANEQEKMKNDKSRPASKPSPK